jgi:hypothetical protein
MEKIFINLIVENGSMVRASINSAVAQRDAYFSYVYTLWCLGRFLITCQVFKEEEEAVKVELHEGCGRIKLYWTMALADFRTLKGMVEFREAGSGERKEVHVVIPL